MQQARSNRRAQRNAMLGLSLNDSSSMKNSSAARQLFPPGRFVYPLIVRFLVCVRSGRCDAAPPSECFVPRSVCCALSSSFSSYGGLSVSIRVSEPRGSAIEIGCDLSPRASGVASLYAIRPADAAQSRMCMNQALGNVWFGGIVTPAKDGARERMQEVALSLGHPGAQLVSGYFPSRRLSLARFAPNGHRHILEAAAETPSAITGYPITP